MSFEPTATKPLGVLKPPKKYNAFGGFSFARGGGTTEATVDTEGTEARCSVLSVHFSSSVIPAPRHLRGRYPLLCPPGSPFDKLRTQTWLHRGRQRQRWWRGRPRRGLALPQRPPRFPWHARLRLPVSLLCYDMPESAFETSEVWALIGENSMFPTGSLRSRLQ